MEAPLPPNESARLDALSEYGVLDTLEEQAFDDITMLASFVCDAPIALISLVDSNRQWFKSRVGLTATQTPREHAFCAHAILEPHDVLVVNDSLSDPRFVDNPLVTGDPHIRFYAGAPLMSPSGHALGTICVLDRTPRQMPQRKLEALRALARQAVAQLELHHSVQELERERAQMRAYQLQLESYQRQIESSNAALGAQSITDALTGVRNRRGFDRALHEELARAQRSGACASLLLIDVDKFKPYNDAFGHPAGDAALRTLAGVLSGHARPFDVVARYGGEEFAVILPGTDADAALAVAQRLRQAVAAARWSHRPITVSIGAGTAGAQAHDAAQLIAEADRALYSAKRRGGNQVAHAREAE